MTAQIGETPMDKKITFRGQSAFVELIDETLEAYVRKCEHGFGYWSTRTNRGDFIRRAVAEYIVKMQTATETGEKLEAPKLDGISV